LSRQSCFAFVGSNTARVPGFWIGREKIFLKKKIKKKKKKKLRTLWRRLIGEADQSNERGKKYFFESAAFRFLRIETKNNKWMTNSVSKTVENSVQGIFAFQFFFRSLCQIWLSETLGLVGLTCFQFFFQKKFNGKTINFGAKLECGHRALP
jgi:hypothetical protein